MNFFLAGKNLSESHRFKTLYFYSVAIFLSLSAFSIYWRLNLHHLRNLSFVYFAFTFALGLIRPLYSFLAFIFLLPITSGLHIQIETVFAFHFDTLHHPGIDLALGVVASHLLRCSATLQQTSRYQKIPVWIFFSHLYICFATFLAISRNLWQSASFFSLNGLIFNWTRVRTLVWADDYYPLQDLFSYSVALCIVVIAFHHFETLRKFARQIFFYPLFASSFVLAFYGLLQFAFRFGFAKSDFSRGVNSFFPDIHAFGGFMILSAILPTYVLQKDDPRYVRISIYLTQILASVAVVMSGSRFSIITLFFYWLLLAFLKWGRSPKAILTALAVTLICSFLFYQSRLGQVTLANLQSSFHEPSFATFNTLLSLRPELFLTALHMFVRYPLLGLGQGEFNRSSGLSGFSDSPLAISYHGENAHNYFLQTLAELGLVGFFLLASIFLIPYWRQRKFPKLSGMTILAIFSSNVFAHSLLEREVLLILAVAVGFLYFETQSASLKTKRWSLDWSPTLTTSCSILFAALLFLACGEVVSSYHRLPFQYGLQCYDTKKWGDGWTSGLYAVDVPAGKSSVKFQFDTGDSNPKKHPVQVDFGLRNDKDVSTRLLAKSYAGTTEDEVAFSVKSPDGSAIKKAYLKTSRCFVPKNLGLTEDTRHFGIHLKSVVFE